MQTLNHPERTGASIVLAVVGRVVAFSGVCTAMSFGCALGAKKADDEPPFLSQMKTYKREYDAARGDVASSVVFRAARDYEKKFFSPSTDVVGWRGKFAGASTSKVQVWLTVEACDGNFCVAFEADKQGPEDAIFKKLADGNFVRDECVVFAGRVNLPEKSVTESGAMSKPEYRFKFTDLQRCPKP